MTLTSDSAGHPDAWWEDAGPSRLSRLVASRWSWLLAAAVSFLILEVTSNPALAVAAGCLKFGWRDFRMAWTLRRVDPDWKRARACGWFHLALGWLKVSGAAFGMIVVIGLIAGMILRPALGPRRLAGPRDTVVTALVIGTLAFLIASTTSIVAVFSAWRHGVRVWVGGSANRAKLVLLATLIEFGMGVTVPSILVGISAMNGRKPPAWVFMGLSFVVSLGLPVVILTLTEALARRVVADRPEDCWPVPLDFSRPARSKADPFGDASGRGYGIE